jgi:hypothetical protein
MLDQSPIRMRTLLLKRNLDPMIGDPPFQAFKPDSQLFVTPHGPLCSQPYRRWR